MGDILVVTEDQHNDRASISRQWGSCYPFIIVVLLCLDFGEINVSNLRKLGFKVWNSRIKVSSNLKKKKKARQVKWLNQETYLLIIKVIKSDKPEDPHAHGRRKEFAHLSSGFHTCHAHSHMYRHMCPHTINKGLKKNQ